MSSINALRLRLQLGAGVLALCATPAFAKDAPASAADTPAVVAQPAPQPEAAQDQASNPQGDVIVTATKRATNLQKTPISISVLSAQDLKDRHVQSLYDLADGAVPSLRVATFEARQNALTIGIRGIVPLDANQPAREQGVGIYIDGVYLGRQHGLNAALFDLERIEVLKGPQGTLFGRNTEGGALSLVSRGPSGQFDLRATAGVSNYNGYNADLHVDLPTIANFSFKVDALIQHQDETIRNPLPGQRGWNYYDRRGIRVATRWQPFNNYTADLAVDVGRDASTPFYSQLLNYNPNNCRGTVNGVNTPASAQPQCVLPGTNPTSFSGTIAALPPAVVVNGTSRVSVADIGVPQQDSVDTTFGVSLTQKWKVTSFLELRSITAYREVQSYQWDNSGGAHRPPVFRPTLVNGVLTGNAFSRYSLADLWQHQWSQEIQLLGELPRFNYVAGLYYFYEKASDDAATPNTNSWNATGTDYTINDPRPTIPGFRSIDRASTAESTSYAIFGQAVYNPPILDDQLHLTVGGRVTRDERSGRLFTVNNIPRPYTYALNTTRFNPSVTLDWQATPDINAYIKYSTGYRAGGASSRSVTYRQFGPEDLQNYEVGFKTQWWDRRIRLNIAAYIADRKNSQVDFSTVQFDAITNSNRNTIETVNAPGVTKIRGVEIDGSITPVQGLTISGGYAYTYTRIPPVANPVTGVLQQVYIVFTPRNAVNGALDYSYALTGGSAVKLHVDVNYAQATQAFDQYATKADASVIVNGRLSLADIKLNDSGARFTLSVWARNLFNYAYVYRRDPSNSLGGLPAAVVVNGQNTFPVSSVNNILGDYGNFNAPRTFGIEGTVRL